MGQQISIEAALNAFRRKYGEAADQVVLLEARVAELEEENGQLRGQLPERPMEPTAVYPGSESL